MEGIAKTTICKHCYGTGKNPAWDGQICSRCYGSGTEVVPDEEPQPALDQIDCT